MKLNTVVSAKGQVVLPRPVRDLLHWAAGTRLEVITSPGAVTLRALVPTDAAGSIDDMWARIDALSSYNGPTITDEDMRQAVLERAAASYPPQ